VFQQAVSNHELNAVPAAAPARPTFVKPFWWEDPSEAGRVSKQGKGSRMNCRRVVRAFLEGTFHGEMMGYGTHFYTISPDGSELWLEKRNNRNPFRICVAKRIAGNFYGNSSSICGSPSVAKDGKWLWQSVRLVIQETMAECIPMVPFRMLEEAGLNIDQLRILDQGPELWFEFGYAWREHKQKTHFMGAMLFSIGEKHFLFDCDQGELKYEVLNMFLSRLHGSPRTIAEAYESLKPQEVRDAERFLGRPCVRQGEWFFIPVPGEHHKSKKPVRSVGWGGINVQCELRAKGNRPHYVEELSDDGFVRGRVIHGGREHKEIKLDGWCRPVGNGAVESFKISGAID
jgi:hypothetical protein